MPVAFVCFPATGPGVFPERGDPPPNPEPALSDLVIDVAKRIFRGWEIIPLSFRDDDPTVLFESLQRDHDDVRLLLTDLWSQGRTIAEAVRTTQRAIEAFRSTWPGARVAVYSTLPEPNLRDTELEPAGFIDFVSLTRVNCAPWDELWYSLRHERLRFQYREFEAGDTRSLGELARLAGDPNAITFQEPLRVHQIERQRLFPIFSVAEAMAAAASPIFRENGGAEGPAVDDLRAVGWAEPREPETPPIDLRGRTFERGLLIERVKVPSIRIEGCTFGGPLILRNVAVSGTVIIRGNMFREGLVFRKTDCQDDALVELNEFIGEHPIFTRVVFQHRVTLRANRRGASGEPALVGFNRCRFEGRTLVETTDPLVSDVAADGTEAEATAFWRQRGRLIVSCYFCVFKSGRSAEINFPYVGSSRPKPAQASEHARRRFRDSIDDESTRIPEENVSSIRLTQCIIEGRVTIRENPFHADDSDWGLGLGVNLSGSTISGTIDVSSIRVRWLNLERTLVAGGTVSLPVRRLRDLPSEAGLDGWTPEPFRWDGDRPGIIFLERLGLGLERPRFTAHITQSDRLVENSDAHVAEESGHIGHYRRVAEQYETLKLALANSARGSRDEDFCHYKSMNYLRTADRNRSHRWIFRKWRSAHERLKGLNDPLAKLLRRVFPTSRPRSAAIYAILGMIALIPALLGVFAVAFFEPWVPTALWWAMTLGVTGTLIAVISGDRLERAGEPFRRLNRTMARPSGGFSLLAGSLARCPPPLRSIALTSALTLIADLLLRSPNVRGSRLPLFPLVVLNYLIFVVACRAFLQHTYAFASWLIFKRFMGYGVLPLRVVVSSLVIIFLFALVYLMSSEFAPQRFGEIRSTQPDTLVAADRKGDPPAAGSIVPEWVRNTLGRFVECLYFSVVTFTTLGYGDFVPTNWLRWVAGLEALVGACMMSMFIVTIARRIIRR